jgi:hypothetical protein
MFWSMLSSRTSRPTSSVIVGEEVRPLRGVELAGRHHPVHEDLDVDLVVGAVHAGGVVDCIRVQDDALQRGFDAAPLSHAQVSAFAHNLDPQVTAVHPDGVIGFVAHQA